MYSQHPVFLQTFTVSCCGNRIIHSLYSLFIYFWDSVLLCSPDGSGTCWVYQAGLRIKDTHLLLPPEGLDERWAPPYLTTFSTLKLEAIFRGGSSHLWSYFHILFSIEPKKDARLILFTRSHNPTATCQSEYLYSFCPFTGDKKKPGNFKKLAGYPGFKLKRWDSNPSLSESQT